MGALHTYLHRIPEARLDGLMDYFSSAEADSGRIGPDLETFLQTFRAGGPGEARPLEPEVRAAYVGRVIDLFRWLERHQSPYSDDHWRESAVYVALGYFATGKFYLGTALPEDLLYKNWGNCWPYLDAACEGRGDREAARLFRRLMLDRDSPNDFLPCVQASTTFLALLRPAETRRLLGAIPLLERFHAAIPEPAGSGTSGAGAGTPRWSFRGELRALIDEMKSWGEEPTCLVSSADTS
jgi:hypothetical protein